MVEAAFYGDDFTGSTDAMVQFARVGLRAVLLVTLPSAPELRELAGRYDVIGVAGIARSLPPDEQEAEVRPVLEALRELGPRVLQYKVCSTADSSPSRGSIGRALEIGREVCGRAVVPILIAQPELGRYTVFSHHFAAEAGTIHRLDRQPTMSTHPSTPMHESDLRRHLSLQTALPLSALHLTSYSNGAVMPGGVGAVVLDALTDEDLRTLGGVILRDGSAGEVRFAIGSGGLSRALGLALRPEGEVVGSGTSGAGGPVLVVSGSQSPRTAEQIEHARLAGWTVLPLDDEVAEWVVGAFSAGGEGVVVHTNGVAPEELGWVPGVLAEVVRRAAGVGVRRVVVAGGDTSGQVLRELEVRALELAGGATPISPGVHLCRAASAVPGVHGLEVLLKPGQLGGVELFTEFQRWSG
ncbi:four-carbon acid sugar kinase family protein [Kribbella speibonae]|uniref:Four-carbon acid sugar kinase family protein n=1 Tax=Kribbella speibonae TaxID=1572660 RepID=A0A4V6N443_9ACTN|nr:four-carbon acid sugar kinase family protein [Kribbella speibonae]TCC34072.1 four-carbon acid sugar kinase family protein [Kribbella speibonae]